MDRHYGVLPLIKRDSIVSLLKKGERLDGRKVDEFREISVETGLISKAEGSALVRIGDTKVIAGVKANIGAPFPDTPDKGVQIVNAELIPVASPVFEAGPPGEEGIELARVVDRGLRSSEMIRLEELSIIPGKKVWTIFIDIYPLDHYGNLIDASGLAAVSAVLTGHIFDIKVEGEEITIVEGSEKPIPIGKVPIFVTIAKIGDALVVDPSYEEELVADSMLTFSIDEDKNICAIQKSGSGALTFEEVSSAKNMALKVAEKIRNFIPKID